MDKQAYEKIVGACLQKEAAPKWLSDAGAWVGKQFGRANDEISRAVRDFNTGRTYENKMYLNRAAVTPSKNALRDAIATPLSPVDRKPLKSHLQATAEVFRPTHPALADMAESADVNIARQAFRPRQYNPVESLITPEARNIFIDTQKKFVGLPSGSTPSVIDRNIMDLYRRMRKLDDHYQAVRRSHEVADGLRTEYNNAAGIFRNLGEKVSK